MLRAIYPGSFDPVTKGHMDIIERASKTFDEVVVGVLENPNKRTLFTVEERIEQLKIVTAYLENVKIEAFRGLLVDFAQRVSAKVLIRGVRTVSDFEAEFQRAIFNKRLDNDMETFFMVADPAHMVLSSTGVKEVLAFGGNIDTMVPEQVKQFILDKCKQEVQ